MKKIVFLGYTVTPEEANTMTGASVAGNKMQWDVVKNLSQIDDIEITCVTISPRASFPHDKQLFEKSSIKQLLPKVKFYNIAYCNVPVLKQFSQIISVYRIAGKLIKELDAGTLLCFNLFPQVGIPMRWLKKKFQHIETVCLLADLPIDGNTKRKGISIWLRNCMEKSTWKSMKVCNKYIVLNKYAMEKYLPDKPYIVVDGGIDEEDIARYQNNVLKNEERNILFSGALTEYNGIFRLIDAMDRIKDLDIYLDIYGDGYLVNEVKEAALSNQKIRYHGRVSNALVMQKQREAWLLINPRIIDDPISQVTFPSKTFEYLLSGTPVLTTKLNSYGSEYDDIMYFSKDDTVSGISDAIRMIEGKTNEEMNKKAECAKQFVISQKLWSKQCEKIVLNLKSWDTQCKRVNEQVELK